jgi:hypothetical protein
MSQPTTTKQSTRKPTAPLIIETHPQDYNGYPFLTLVQYRKVPILVVVDNMDTETIRAFVVDLCDPEGLDKELLFKIAEDWFEHDKNLFPISIAFSKLGITAQMSKIYRVLNIELVSRVIGPAPKFPMSEIKSVRRRRRKQISQGIEIIELAEDDIFE